MIGPSNIGDALLMSDVVARVHHRYPAAHLTLVLGARARALFVDDPRVQALVDTDAFDTPLGRWRLAWALWRYRPQVVVDLRTTLYPLLLQPWRGWRYLRQPPRRLRHARDRYRWKLEAQVPALRPDGADELKALPALSCTAKDLAQAEALWRRWGIVSGRPVVIVCPGARSHIKRWLPQGFAAVADRLILEAHAEVILSGEPEEKPVVEEILSVMRQPAHSAVGLTTIRQLGVLMQRANLVLTNDSASLHLASAVGVPTVAIFGPTDAQTYGPTAPRNRTVRRRLFCAPCEQALCRFSHECMRYVTSDEVYAAAKELLNAGR